MTVCIAMTADGQTGDGFGRASHVGIADVREDGTLARFEMHEVGWDKLRDLGAEGEHHARIARFLMDHGVKRVMTGHMGPGMEHMLDKMGIDVVVGVSGDAKHAVVTHVG